MILLKSLLSYVFVLAGIEALLLIGGRRSHQDFIIAASAALAGTIAWRILRTGKTKAAHLPGHACRSEFSQSFRSPAARGQPDVLHGSSPSR